MGVEMSEERVFIQSEGLKIEGMANHIPGQGAVVVTHPHPLFGGDMYNTVVESIVQAYREKGYTTLRFNFRGVGQSEGSHDQGVGEQEDVRAAVAYLHGLGKGFIDLAGYSFGAWVSVFGLKKFTQAKRVIMVSPPVNFMDFSSLDFSPKIRLVITGSEDDIAPPLMIKDMLPVWNPEAILTVVQGADHFYWGNTSEIKEIIQDFLDHENV
jgi:alpha/beta superfamily hydrolase